MKISFVIPAYNEEVMIKICLASLIKEIANSKKVDTEIIVVNNASKDNTREAASSFLEVTVVDEPHKGIVWARRAGFLASSGDLIANVDSDTMMPKGWLNTVINEFKKDPNLLALSGPQVYYDLPMYSRAIVKVWYIIGLAADRTSHLLFKNGSMLQGGNYIIRRSALEKIGGYDTSIQFYGEDTDVGRRLNQVGKVKWTFKLPIYASGRRIKVNGIIKTGITYAMTFIWISIIKKPFTQNYNDIREGKK